MFLAVPQELLSRDKLALSIRIDQLRPSSVVSLAEFRRKRTRTRSCLSRVDKTEKIDSTFFLIGS
jgi:hypothetical protein